MTNRRTKISPKSGRGLGHVTPTIFGSTVGYPSNSLASCFNRAMHFSAKRGIAIACRLSVRLSVCDVGELWSHRLEFFESNFTVI